MNKNSFLARWITGIVLAAILLSIILLASLEILTLVIAVIIAGGLWEYNHIVFGKGFLKEKIESHLFALALPFLALIGDERLLIAFMAFAVIIIRGRELLQTIKKPAAEFKRALKEF